MDGVFKTSEGIVHIVGGGIQGCFAAIALQEELGLSHSRIRIYDPQPLLHNWLNRSRSCSMVYLRSNSSHSIHVNFNSLRNFVRDRGMNPWKSTAFALPYHRPSLNIFNEHAEFCIDQYRLNTIHVPETVEALIPEGGVRVAGRNLPGTVLYTGDNSELFLPQWAKGKHTMFHVFNMPEGTIPRFPCIIGGGISALQLAISLAKNDKSPCLITRRPLEIFRFDFNPCYVGPRCLPELENPEHSEGGEQRMKKVLRERFSGTIPREIYTEFQELLNTQSASCEVIPDESVLRERLGTCDMAIFCTGFTKEHSPDPLLKKPGQQFVCGYPVLGNDLRWGRRVFVSGRNAMYRVGPAAPNIIGAHLAWRIIKKQLLNGHLYKP